MGYGCATREETPICHCPELRDGYTGAYTVDYLTSLTHRFGFLEFWTPKIQSSPHLTYLPLTTLMILSPLFYLASNMDRQLPPAWEHFSRVDGLRLFYNLFQKTEAEQPKPVFLSSYRAAAAQLSIHIVLVLTSITVISVNLIQLYLGRNIPGTPVDRSIIITILQVVAKLHEVLIVASQTTIVFPIIRIQLLSRPGIPFGFLPRALMFSSPSYFWLSEFWGAMTGRISRLRRILTALRLVTVGLIASRNRWPIRRCPPSPERSGLECTRQPILSQGHTRRASPSQTDHGHILLCFGRRHPSSQCAQVEDSRLYQSTRHSYRESKTKLFSNLHRRTSREYLLRTSLILQIPHRSSPSRHYSEALVELLARLPFAHLMCLL